MKGHDVRALAINGQALPGVSLDSYPILRANGSDVHRLAIDFESKVIRAESCANKMLFLRDQGFIPDLIVAHPGWGESLFCKSVFPNAKLVHFIEFHYGKGLDVNFDPEFLIGNNEDSWRIKVKDAANLLSLDLMDLGISPTQWQKSSIPDLFQSKVEVVFDGVDTTRVKPDSTSFIKLSSDSFGEKRFSYGDEVLTFVNRNLEPYRGYHSFMRSLPRVMKVRPNANIIIVGGDEVSYGKPPSNGKSWKDIYLEEVMADLDMSRIFFVGKIPYNVYLNLLQVSRCHVYLTYPFVMSWSAIEAMSAGALVVGSNTPPVREFIEHEKNGLLVDFFDYENLASTVIDCLANPKIYNQLKKAARSTIIERYDLNSICIPKQLSLLSRLMDY